MGFESNARRFFTALGLALGAGVALLVRRRSRDLARGRRFGLGGATPLPSPLRVTGAANAARDTARLHPTFAGGEGKSARRVGAARLLERERRLAGAPLPRLRSVPS